MKDIIKKYRKHNFFQNGAIVITSLAIALGVNTYILDGKVGEYLKTSVLDINGVEQTSDIYGKVSDDRKTITLWTQKPMKHVKSISLSLTYNDSDVVIKEIESIIPETSVTFLLNEPGIATLFVTFDTPRDLWGETDFLSVEISKNSTGTAYLNILNANFKDVEENNFLLSTSGILF